MKKALIVALTGATLMSLTACGIGKDPLASDDGGSSDGAIVVGSADFPESQLIATIYAEALRANGIDVTEKLNIGSREVYVPAIRDGSIDLLPEYSGALLQYLDSATTATASDEVTAEIKAKLPAGLVALEPSPAEDKDVLAVRQETATSTRWRRSRTSCPTPTSSPSAARPNGRPGRTASPACGTNTD